MQHALDAGDLARASQLCEARLRDDPSDADAYRYIGQIHSTRGYDYRALRAARRACELAPTDPRAWSDLGRVHAKSRELSRAIGHFRHALQLDPRYVDGWHNLGTALKQQGNCEEAFAALKQALLLDGNRAETYLNLGNLLVETDQFDDAIQCFERAARLDPTLARAQSTGSGTLATRSRAAGGVPVPSSGGARPGPCARLVRSGPDTGRPGRCRGSAWLLSQCPAAPAWACGRSWPSTWAWCARAPPGSCWRARSPL